MPTAPLPESAQDPEATIRRLAEKVDSQTPQQPEISEIETNNQNLGDPVPDREKIILVTGSKDATDKTDTSETAAMHLGERLLSRNPDLYRKRTIPLGPDLILSKMTRKSVTIEAEPREFFHFKSFAMGFYEEYIFFIGSKTRLSFSVENISDNVLATWFQNVDVDKPKPIDKEGQIIDTTSVAHNTMLITKDVHGLLDKVKVIDEELMNDKENDRLEEQSDKESQDKLKNDINHMFPIESEQTK